MNDKMWKYPRISFPWERQEVGEIFGVKVYTVDPWPYNKDIIRVENSSGEYILIKIKEEE